MKWSPKSIAAVSLTATVCLVIIIMIISFIIVPPGTVKDDTKEKMFQLITFIAGIVSGWILRGDTTEEKKEEEKPKV